MLRNAEQIAKCMCINTTKKDNCSALYLHISEKNDEFCQTFFELIKKI